MYTQIKSFILHLRLNYNFFILSAPFLLGAVYVSKIINIKVFTIEFFVLYIFLFGGANVYNSYFDKDTGPIGGLKRPPSMERWMYVVSWIFQIVGLFFAFGLGLTYAMLFAFSSVLSWLYSNPYFRYKGKPIASFFVIGIGTVFNTTVMGYIAAGGKIFSSTLLLASLGATLIILSMYPFSQIYQRGEDTQRKDMTFAVRYGVSGVKKTYLVLFPLGIVLLACSFIHSPIFLITSLCAGFLAYLYIWHVIQRIQGIEEEYGKIMKIKYSGGLFFTLVVLTFLLIR